MTVKRKRSGAWMVEFRATYATGPLAGLRVRVRERSIVNTKRGAEDFERLLRERIQRGDPLDGMPNATSERPTFGQFAEEFMACARVAGNKPAERQRKITILNTHLLPRFGAVELDTIRLREIEVMRSAILSKRTTKTVNNVVNLLVQILGYAKKLGVVTVVPEVQPLKGAQREARYLTHDEYEKLIDATRADEVRRAIVLLGGDAGLRSGEMAGLEWGDIDFVNSKITIRRNAWYLRGVEHVDLPKGGAERTIDLTTRLRDHLKQMRHLRGKRVLYRASGGSMTPSAIESAVRWARRRAGLKHFSPHTLRHTFCSHLAMAGVDAHTIKMLARHSSITTTQRYMHAHDAHVRDAVERLEVSRSARQLDEAKIRPRSVG